MATTSLHLLRGVSEDAIEPQMNYDWLLHAFDNYLGVATLINKDFSQCKK